MTKAIILANIVVAAILAGVIALKAVSDREQVIESAYQSAENLSGALAKETQQTLAAMDLGLSTAAEAIAPLIAVGEAPTAEINRILANRQSASAVTFDHLFLGPTGALVATSRTPRPDPINLSHLPEFAVHRDHDDGGFVIGTAHKALGGSAKDRWIVNVSRRVDRPDGGFGGVVIASLSLDHILDFYETLRVGQGGTVGLLGSDGSLLVRSPFVERLVGKPFADTLFQRARTGADRGRSLGTGSVDNIARLIAYRRVDGLGVVYVGMAQEEVLSAWWNRVIFDALIGTLAMALFLGASIATAHYFRRRWEWQERRSSRLKLIAEESATIVRFDDVPELLNHVTEVARRLIGAHQSATSLTQGDDYAQAIQAASFSDKYAAWRNYDEAPTGAGIYRLVCESNRPMVMTQAELEKHPAWRGFGAAKERHPPMRGWLAVPIVGQDGGNLGLIQLSDKENGEFDQDDLNELLQLASITGVAVGNIRASEARESALADANAARAEIDTIFSSISDAVFATDAKANLVYVNAEAERTLGRTKADLIGKNVWEAFPEARETELFSQTQIARQTRMPVNFEFFYPPLQAWFSVRAFPHAGGGLTVYFQDITRRMEAEERVRQSQKMDAIGQLTGGIAHDFNNLLTVILGNTDVLVDKLEGGSEDLHRRAETIQRAGERAAELTHHLLAYSRRQPLSPQVVSLNELLGEMEGLLRRTLPANIHIELVRGGGLWKAMVDATELESAVLNLALNARDAMTDGGKLTIETANISVDQTYADNHEIKPGQYVMVAVSDTGTGMTPEVIKKAFDPFFTTKGAGKGSGLGLSMVYGFARQTGGHVRIYSEPGEGTTIRLYIPRASEAGEERPRRASIPVQPGIERVLVVEDDEAVRRHTVDSLKMLGYEVAEFGSGAAAVAALDAGEKVDLLLTDVVLPGNMSGKEVAIETKKRRPEVRVLYMSGYTENSIIHNGRLDRDVHLLSKPFRLADLARKVREVLDE